MRTDPETLKRIEEYLRNNLNAHRYKHTMGVKYTAQCLAMAFGSDIETAGMAGMLHDIAKYMTEDELLKYCSERDMEISGSEYTSPHLLHAKAGEHMAKHLFGIEDPDILNAVRYHTTGRPDMSLLEKIIFTADYIEPSRYKAVNLLTIRHAAFHDLDEAVFMILKDTLDYLSKNTDNIDSNTVAAYEFYKKVRTDRIGRNLFE